MVTTALIVDISITDIVLTCKPGMSPVHTPNKTPKTEKRRINSSVIMRPPWMIP